MAETNIGLRPTQAQNVNFGAIATQGVALLNQTIAARRKEEEDFQRDAYDRFMKESIETVPLINRDLDVAISERFQSLRSRYQDAFDNYKRTRDVGSERELYNIRSKMKEVASVTKFLKGQEDGMTKAAESGNLSDAVLQNGGPYYSMAKIKAGHFRSAEVIQDTQGNLVPAPKGVEGQYAFEIIGDDGIPTGQYVTTKDVYNMDYNRPEINLAKSTVEDLTAVGVHKWDETKGVYTKTEFSGWGPEGSEERKRRIKKARMLSQTKADQYATDILWKMEKVAIMNPTEEDKARAAEYYYQMLEAGANTSEIDGLRPDASIQYQTAKDGANKTFSGSKTPDGKGRIFPASNNGEPVKLNGYYRFNATPKDIPGGVEVEGISGVPFTVTQLGGTDTGKIGLFGYATLTSKVAPFDESEDVTKRKAEEELKVIQAASPNPSLYSIDFEKDQTGKLSYKIKREMSVLYPDAVDSKGQQKTRNMINTFVSSAYGFKNEDDARNHLYKVMMDEYKDQFSNWSKNSASTPTPAPGNRGLINKLNEFK